MEEIKVEWRGTWGVGDFMMALNCVHLHAWRTGKKINLEMHWSHSEDYLHHFEEEETIIERMEYIHNFYLHKDSVRVTHKYNQREGTKYFYGEGPATEKPHKNRFTFSDNSHSDAAGSPIPENDWLFSPSMICNSLHEKLYNRMKVVIWRPLFNAEVPRTWKRLLTNDDWDVIITKLRQAGLHVVELTYRTPVREAMFHIATSRMTLSYCGMWHYIAKNSLKPMAVVSEEGISHYHTGRNGLIVSHDKKSPNSIWRSLDRPSDILGHTKTTVLTYKLVFKDILSYNSLQELASKWRNE